MGKYGFSTGAGEDDVLDPCLNLIFGEKSLITRGHTLSLRRKLNSWCWKIKTKFKQIFFNCYLIYIYCYYQALWSQANLGINYTLRKWKGRMADTSKGTEDHDEMTWSGSYYALLFLRFSNWNRLLTHRLSYI